jgi:hypothetical protein
MKSSVSTHSLMLATISLLALGASAGAQDTEHDWTKTYPVSAVPALTLETGDSGLEIHACGDCRTIRVTVHTDRKLSDFVLEEHQEQNHVTFRLKEHMQVGIHFDWHVAKRTSVTVETPANLTLDARVSDGSVNAHGLSGDLQVQSSDGGIVLDDVHGTLRVKTSDGSLVIHHASGEIDGRSSDGSLDVDGQFSRVQLHTSDGSLSFALAEGSKLTSPSQISSSDGSVKIRLPQTLAADLNVEARDGHVRCALPLKLDGYDSHGSSEHHIAGHLNAGGTPLEVRTSDGSVTIEAL